MTDTTAGRRLLEAQRAATEARWKCERGETAGHLGELLASEARAIELLEAWTDEHLETLLSAAEAGEKMRSALESAEKAIQAAFGQAQAEYQGHDRTADKHDAVIRAWRAQRDAALAGAP